MIPLGHVAGMPVEEFLPWLAGPGTGLVVGAGLDQHALGLRRPANSAHHETAPTGT